MQDLRQIQETTEQRWRSALHRLWQQLEQLTDAYMLGAADLLPYRVDGPDREVGRARARGSYEYMLRTLSGLPVSAELAALPREIATTWARNDVPIDDLVQATHLDFKVLWTALLWNTSKQDLPMLAVNASTLWSVVHAYSVEIQRAYSAEVALVARERLEKQHDLVARLLSSTDPGPSLVATVAAALGVPVESPFAVVAAGRAQRAPLLAAVDAMGDAPLMAFAHDDGEHVVVLVPLVDGDPSPVRAALRDVRCVLAPVAQRLAEVPARGRIARRAADAIPVDVPPTCTGPFELTDLWDRIVSNDIGPWARDLRSEVLGGLVVLDDDERGRLLETVRAYARTGSVTTTATALFCHRNTVINRLRTFREHTGHDMTVPREAAAVIVALACAGP